MLRKFLQTIDKGIAAAAWFGVTLAAALLALAWLWPTERFGGVLAAVAFGAAVVPVYLALACGLAMLIAAGRKRWVLAAVAAVVGLVALVGQHQALLAADRPAGVPLLRVMTANVYFRSTDATLFLAEIARTDPDLILVQEQTPTYQALVADALAEAYPHQIHEPRTDPGGYAVYSKLPIAEVPGDAYDDYRVHHSGRRYEMTVASQPIVVWNVHPKSPGGIAAIAGNHDQTLALLAAAQSETLPTILAGDFNHPPTSAPARALDAADVRSSLALTGDLFPATWPQVRPDFPDVLEATLPHLPRVQIDYIRLSPTLTATAAEVGHPIDGDHLPVIADIALTAK
jgi:endonuclease/exonuclease/phosphatase (EEP) superfamily protein YafD